MDTRIAIRLNAWPPTAVVIFYYMKNPSFFVPCIYVCAVWWLWWRREMFFAYELLIGIYTRLDFWTPSSGYIMTWHSLCCACNIASINIAVTYSLQARKIIKKTPKISLSSTRNSHFVSLNMYVVKSGGLKKKRFATKKGLSHFIIQGPFCLQWLHAIHGW